MNNEQLQTIQELKAHLASKQAIEFKLPESTNRGDSQIMLETVKSICAFMLSKANKDNTSVIQDLMFSIIAMAGEQLFSHPYYWRLDNDVMNDILVHLIKDL